jgi:ANTAR domain/GAF domain
MSAPLPSSLDQSEFGLAKLFAQIGVHLSGQASTADAFGAVSRTAVTMVPGAQWAGITRGRDGRFETVGATHPVVNEIDDIQYALGSGPCVDAVVQHTVFRTGDLGADRRWPEFGARAVAEAGLTSMLSFRLLVQDDTLIAGLNLYSQKPDAFDQTSEVIGTLVATYGAMAVDGVSTRERASNLQRALATSREIGIAIGVLMSQHKVTRGQAFDLLRIASQASNQKLAELARDVADTGVLPIPMVTPGSPPQ